MNNDPKKSYGFDSELDDFSADDWAPKKKTSPKERKKPAPEQVAKVAAKAGFTSREPKPQKEPEGQVSIRAPLSLIEEFKEFGKTQQPKWPHSYVLQRAMEALKRELNE